ncbi:ABC transporter ATP-binding protein [Kribbella albertanoniae]|uniref:ABC transporter ATP-binding protein n=1 Tax=Kribbella albertanoniae TaxID=1266829 RepID=A0A4R4Q8M3_9ACTN|nr:ABC transporter ATP-binding protein [Kribbella albertanoniae]TDC31283.1 ABC transporter ATP-binding protein [Kribbella albertanoniae]
MINRLLALWPHPAMLRTLTIRYAVLGVLQGGMLLGLIPLLQALLQSPPDLNLAARWTGIIAVLGVAYLGALWWAKSLGYRIAHLIMRDLQHGLGRHLLTLPLGWFVGDRAGRTARTVAQSTPSAASIVSHVWPELVQSIATPLTVVAGVFLIDWRMGLAFLVTLPAAMVILRWSAPIVRETQVVMDDASSEAAGRAIEFAQAQPVLRATGRAQEGFAPMERALDQQRVAFRAALNRHTMPQIAYIAVVQVGFTIVLVSGALLALAGELSLAETIALLVLAARFVEPLAQVGNLFGTIRVAEVAIDRVAEVLDAAPLPEPAQPKPSGDSTVEFDNVTFGYGGRPVLNDFGIRVPAGTMTALVGPSGSGKTTVLRLICRFWDVNGGSVRVGGVDVRELTTDSLMSQLAIVFQDTYLFDGTLAENLRLAAPDATDDELADAAAASRLDEVVARMPDGWDTRVGEGGLSLSGGERQRVAIARALLKEAPIVLLDEATAALDPENDAAVTAGLTALTSRGRTVVVIAHRLTTIEQADQIVVIDGGRTAEVGSHDELMARGATYARFYRERLTAASWQVGGR